MRHLLNAGAAALALYALGCSPCLQPPKAPEPYDVEGEAPRFGAMPAVAFALDQATTADITSPVVSDTGLKLLCFQFVVIATGDPVGVIEIEGSLDGTNYNDLYLDENKVYGTAAAWEGGTQVPISDPAATQSILLCVEHPMPHMRLFYDRTSGGAAAGADIYTHAQRNM